MHVVITGAAGFVGRALARRLEMTGRLRGRPVDRLTLIDLSFDGPPAGAMVAHRAVDLADPPSVRQAVGSPPVDVLFHLASIPGGTAERQYALARAVNLDATLSLLEICKSQVEAGGPVPVFVFASSIATIGALPAEVDDDTPMRPQMTYGAQKLMGEVLVDDFSRRGWIDGRSPRLPGVLARPPARTGQLSAFLSDLLREPAAGRPFTCPTSPGATTWASSLPCVVDNLLFGAEAPAEAFGGTRALTLPTLRFSMAEAVDAVAAVCATRVHELVRWAPDERIEALFGRFPPLATARADAIGFRHDGDLSSLVRRSLDPG
jgi:nucleoside-diphosphate-sugar epimerase